MPEIHCKNTMTMFQLLWDGILVPVCFTTYNSEWHNVNIATWTILTCTENHQINNTGGTIESLMNHHDSEFVVSGLDSAQGYTQKQNTSRIIHITLKQCKYATKK